MILKTIESVNCNLTSGFAEIPEGAIAGILLDDEVVNHAFFDANDYLHICQALAGNRQIEIELHPSEVKKLTTLLDRQEARLERRIDHNTQQTIWINVAGGLNARGSFLTSFAKAYVAADLSNRRVLNEASISLIEKYELNQQPYITENAGML